MSSIDSTLGNPLFADDCTTNVARISYARILIEMYITRPLPKCVKVKDPKGVVFEQEVTYE